MEAARMAQKCLYFDSTRARREIGFAPQNVVGALERAIRWFRDEGYVDGRRVDAEAAGPAREVRRQA